MPEKFGDQSLSHRLRIHAPFSLSLVDIALGLRRGAHAAMLHHVSLVEDAYDQLSAATAETVGGR